MVLRRESYLSVGYFHKDVSNFISTTRVDQTAFDLHTPVGGPRYLAALAALGSGATAGAIRDYIAANYPSTVVITGYRADLIRALPEDPLLNFQINTPTNSDQKATIHGWEFNIQHSFWNTGFGVIANYTIVNGSAKYNNELAVERPAVRAGRASATAPTPSCSTTSTASRRASPTTGATSSSPEAGPTRPMSRPMASSTAARATSS